MPRTSNLLWALDARVPSDRTYHVSVLSSGAAQPPVQQEERTLGPLSSMVICMLPSESSRDNSVFKVSST